MYLKMITLYLLQCDPVFQSASRDHMPQDAFRGRRTADVAEADEQNLRFHAAKVRINRQRMRIGSDFRRADGPEAKAEAGNGSGMHLRLRTSRSAERCPKSGRKPEYSRPDARNGRPRVRDEQGGRRVASRRAAAARKAYPSRAEIRAAARSVCRPAAPAPLTPCGGGLCGLPRGFPRRAACGFSVLQWKPLDRLFPFVPRCRGFHVCANWSCLTSLISTILPLPE